MKKILCILLIAFSINSYSQHKGDVLRHVYISLKQYKKKYKKPLTKNDSLNFIYRDNDTLVQVKNYIKPKGTSVPYEYKDSTFLYYYKKVAFNHKNDSVSKKTSMKYWKNDIRIFFSKSISKNTKKELMSFAKNISSQIDSLKISEVKKVEKSNYIVYYFGDYDYESRMANNKNTDFYIYWRQNKIYRGAIKIDTKVFFNEKLIIYKIKELFFKTLGYFKFIDDFNCESYFSNCYSPHKKMSELDLELLKYHYSYGICKGTDLETFEEQHKKAKELLSKNKNNRMRFFHEY